jgi:hypothetical protein
MNILVHGISQEIVHENANSSNTLLKSAHACSSYCIIPKVFFDQEIAREAPFVVVFIYIKKKNSRSTLGGSKTKKWELAIHKDGISEKLLLVWFHSVGLEWGFLKETKLQFLEGGAASVKYIVISLFPYQPGSQHEDFHKERCGALLLSITHYGIEVQIEVSIDASHLKWK